jgi:hypothetical protein
MTICRELLDELLSNYQKPEDLPGNNGLLKWGNDHPPRRTLAHHFLEHT